MKEVIVTQHFEPQIKNLIDLLNILIVDRADNLIKTGAHRQQVLEDGLINVMQDNLRDIYAKHARPVLIIKDARR